MKIEPADIAKISDIAKIHTSCWSEVYHFIPQHIHKARNRKYREKQWRDVLDNPETGSQLYVLMSDEGEVCGFCYCKPNDDEMIDALSELHAAYVLPDFRGGITGPLMMHTMVEYLLDISLLPVCLWAFNKNPVGRWYRAMGWKSVISRDRELFDTKIPETGYIHPDPQKLLKRLQRIIDAQSAVSENR